MVYYLTSILIIQVNVKVEVTKSDSETSAEHSDHPLSEQPDLAEHPERASRGTRGDRRSEKFIPAESEQPYNKSHYHSGRGRVKPTKGSEIQLNIFSLVQVSLPQVQYFCTESKKLLDYQKYGFFGIH